MKALEELKNVCEKATSSPWYFSNHEEIRDVYHDDGHDTIYVIKEASEAIEDEDARFIVVARQALPVLIELVEALEHKSNFAEQSALFMGTAWVNGQYGDICNSVEKALAKLESLEV